MKEIIEIAPLGIKKIILVTGGAGFIGSATVLNLAQQNYKVIVLDTQRPQSTFFQHASRSIKAEEFYKNPTFLCSHEHKCPCIAEKVIFIQSDYSCLQLLDFIFNNFTIEAVMHFAASIEVSLSVKQPHIFYSNNVVKTITLLDCMIKHAVTKFIFSSSCAVYGIPHGTLSENHPTNPISPYGKTKLIIEQLLLDYAHAYNISSISLRYFNAAGALPEYDIIEKHTPETHIIPLLLQAAYTNKPFNIFGTDYDTPDGTCIRDYIHVADIAQAHILALNKLLGSQNTLCDYFNLGTGTGYSIYQLINTLQEITNKKIYINKSARRAGDPAVLQAHAQKAREILNWVPQNSSLENILKSALESYQSAP